ncbi:MAG: FAD-dependent oxidoreductase [Clostridia bacterium]|nr:FAD-dependent oxidoreductase [Clostridia bacterium]
MTDIITEPQRDLKVAGTYDVAVCGGGIAGISAALAAARNGAKTVLFEREFLLGGLATSGLVTIYLPLCDGMGRQVSFGISEELLRLSVSHGYEIDEKGYHTWISPNRSITKEDKIKHRFEVQFNPYVFALNVERLLLENGIDILYGTVISSVLKEKNKISYLITESKSGRTAFKVKSVVDCTGDADIVHQSGENEALFSQGNVLSAWYYSINNRKYNLNMLGFSDVPDNEKAGDGTELIFKKKYGGLDQKELSQQVISSHNCILNHFLKDGKISENHTITSVATVPQIRMTRRLNGTYVMTANEMHKEFPDSVGLFSDWRKPGPVFEMPFSVLHGNKIKNLICAGRNISVTDALWDVTRVIPVCAVSGEAAGTAAAIYNDFSVTDISVLQKKLQNNGIILHENQCL